MRESRADSPARYSAIFEAGHDRRRGSAVEQRVPEAQAKDSDHPSCSMVRLFVHVQNENVANANREGKQDCAGVSQ